MLTRIHVTVLILLTIVVWACVLLASGVAISWEHAKPFAITVTAVSLCCLAFDRLFWRFRIFHGWLIERPNLQGSWRVVIQSSWEEPQTRERDRPRDGVMVIRQTCSELTARLFTQESSSILISHKLIKQNDGVFQLAGVYQNTPDISLRGDRSEIHFGSVLLDVLGNPATGMSGHYWTDRKTKGSLRLSDRRKELFADYAEGARVLNLQQ